MKSNADTAGAAVPKPWAANASSLSPSLASSDGSWSTPGKRHPQKSDSSPSGQLEGDAKRFIYSREELLSFYRADQPTPASFSFIEKITSHTPFFPVAFQPEDAEVRCSSVIILFILSQIFGLHGDLSSPFRD